MIINKEFIGMRISEVRKEKELSLEEFGKIIDNTDKNTVSKWV